MKTKTLKLMVSVMTVLVVLMGLVLISYTPIKVETTEFGTLTTYANGTGYFQEVE